MGGSARSRNILIGSAAALTIALGGLGVAAAAGGASSDATSVSIDEGADLLPRAKVTLDEAVAAAQSGAAGTVGEIDLEYYEGTLVFNVDVGDQDVKVDASKGDVIAMGND